MKLNDNDELEWSNGKKVYCLSSTVGLDLISGELRTGYDSELIVGKSYDKDSISKEDVVELAAFMISKWTDVLLAAAK